MRSILEGPVRMITNVWGPPFIDAKDFCLLEYYNEQTVNKFIVLLMLSLSRVA